MMIETKGIAGSRKLLIEHYDEFMAILKIEGYNVVSAGTETHNHTTYFRIILKR